MAAAARSLFAAFDEFAITPATVKAVVDWPPKRVMKLLETLQERIKEPATVTNTPFSFVANDYFSGLPAPFGAGHIRLAAADRLARFAALYADSVLVRNPIERYLRAEVALTEDGERHVVRDRLTPGAWPEHLHEQIALDLAVMLSFRPLAEAGLLHFVGTRGHWCPLCIHLLVTKKQLQKLPSPTEEREWQRKLAAMVGHIEKAYVKRGRVLVHSHGDHSHGVIIPPPDLVEYEHVQSDVELPESIARRAQKPLRIGIRDARRTRILHHEIDRIISDISTQNACVDRYGCQYITARALDLELIDAVNSPSARRFNRAAVDALAHPVPFLERVPLSALVNLRAKEEESFQVYRDAMTELLRQVKTEDAKRMKQAFAEIVQPELNGLSLKLKKSRKTILSEFASNSVIVAGTVSLAAFSGLLPPNLGIPAIGAAALGAWKGAKGIAATVAKLANAPKEVEESRYYFLWKAQQPGRR